MRLFTVVTVLALTIPPAHAQQYGWVQVAQLGNQFTSLQAVEFVDSLHGWTAEGASAIYRTTDGGNTWTPYDAAAGFVVSSISMRDTSIGWAVGSQSLTTGKIIRTSDGGRTWSLQWVADSRVYTGTSTTTSLKNVTSGYARNPPDTGKVVQTTNGGTTWTERTIADSIERFGKVQFVDSIHGWIATGVRGQPGGILRTTDGGTSWTLSITSFFKGISFVDTLQGWGITPGRSLFKTTDGGISWQFLGGVGSQDDDLGANAISFIDSSNGWVFGVIFYQGDLAGAIYRTNDGGASWSRELAGGGTRDILDGMMLDHGHGWAVGDFGSVFAYRIVSSVPERLDRMPKSFALKQNYPNPFNPTTNIEYEIVQRSHVTLTVYDISGKEVRQLINEEQESGVYRVHFDPRGLASGTYLYTMKTNSFTETKHMVLVK